jgi:hypothetical protein
MVSLHFLFNNRDKINVIEGSKNEKAGFFPSLTSFLFL